MKSYQLKNNAASHSERGIAYKRGDVVRTDRNLIALHPAKFIEVGNMPDSYWPEDVPFKDNGDNKYYATTSNGSTFQVMQGSEVSRRGLTAQKAFQLVRNWNNGSKHVAAEAQDVATPTPTPKAEKVEEKAPVNEDAADEEDEEEEEVETPLQRKARLKAEKKAKKNRAAEDDE
jgi:hypothetical protein